MKFKISPLNIFSVYLIGLCIYIFAKPVTDGLEGAFVLFALIPSAMVCIGIDFFLQSRIKIIWKVWIYEALLVIVIAWVLALP